YTRGFIFDQRIDYILKEEDLKHRSVGKVELINNKKAFKAKTDLYKGDNLEVTTDRDKKLPLTLTKDYKRDEIIFLDKYRDAKINPHVLMLNAENIKDDLEEGLNSYRNLPVSLSFEGRLGKRSKLKISMGDVKALVVDDSTIEAAQNISLDQEDIRENLARFNDEIFTPTGIEIKIDE